MGNSSEQEIVVWSALLFYGSVWDDEGVDNRCEDSRGREGKTKRSKRMDLVVVNQRKDMNTDKDNITVTHAIKNESLKKRSNEIHGISFDKRTNRRIDKIITQIMKQRFMFDSNNTEFAMFPVIING